MYQIIREPIALIPHNPTSRWVIRSTDDRALAEEIAGYLNGIDTLNQFSRYYAKPCADPFPETVCNLTLLSEEDITAQYREMLNHSDLFELIDDFQELQQEWESIRLDPSEWEEQIGIITKRRLVVAPLLEETVKNDKVVGESESLLSCLPSYSRGLGK